MISVAICKSNSAIIRIAFIDLGRGAAQMNENHESAKSARDRNSKERERETGIYDEREKVVDKKKTIFSSKICTAFFRFQADV